jgi:cytochrome c553
MKNRGTLASLLAGSAILGIAAGCTQLVTSTTSAEAPPLTSSGGGFGGVDSGGVGVFVDPGLRPTFPATVTASTQPPPISGGTLIVLRDGVTAVASDPDRDVVYVVNTTSGTVTFTVSLQPGDEPGRLTEDGAGRVHVALRSGGALVTIDPTLGTVTARRAVCPAPRGVAWDSTTDSVWVACATGELVALPASGGAATTSWTIERDLRDVLVTNGSLTITEFRSAQVLRLGSAGAIARRDVMPQDGAFEPHVAWRAVEGPSGSVVVAHQGHSTQNIQTLVPGGYGSNGPGAVAAECTVLGPDGSVISSVELNNTVLPVDIAVSPDQTFVAVVGAGDSFATELAQVTMVPLGTSTADAGGPLVSLDLSAIADAGPSLVPEPSFPTTAPGGPISAGSVGATLQLGPLNQAIAVAFDGSGHVLVQTREPANLWVIAIPSGGAVSGQWPLPLNAAIALSSASRDDTGHDIFHASAGALIACASCHPEGGDDSHVWTLNGQSRRTPSLRGTIAGTAPYHWPGDEPDLPTLTNDVYTSRMSGQKLDSGQMGALASWIQKIPAPPAPSWVDPAAAARGSALFTRADTACVRCHSGPKFTNNETLDVGTGQPFQVPPLVGVGWRTPLLHDGCALTIADRFGVACATVGHGNISALTPQDISDLSAYLETL